MRPYFLRFSTSLVLTIILVLLSACEFTTANIERATMTRMVNTDNSPMQEVAVFHKYDNVLHCCAKMANTPSGTKVKAVWRRDGDSQSIIDSADVEMTSSTWIDFSLTGNGSGFQYGKYAVDLYINNQFDQSVPFAIEPMFSESVIKEAVLSTTINEDFAPTDIVDFFSTGSEIIYATAYVSDQPVGSGFTASWYQHNSDGERRLMYAGGLHIDENVWIAFSLSLTNGLPEGNYSVDLLHNGTVEHTIEFTAQ